MSFLVKIIFFGLVFGWPGECSDLMLHHQIDHSSTGEKVAVVDSLEEEIEESQVAFLSSHYERKIQRKVRRNQVIKTIYHEPILADLYFDEKRLFINGQMERILHKIITLIRQEHEWRLQMEGHCDSRGTLAYNMARTYFHLTHLSSYLRMKGLVSDRIDLLNIGQDPSPCGSRSEYCLEDNLRAKRIFPIFATENPQRGCLVRLRLLAGKDWKRALELLRTFPYLRRIHVASPLSPSF